MADMDYFSSLPEALRRMIRARGTQADVASGAGLTPAQLSSYLSGRTDPSIGNLGRILDAMDATLIDLWGALLSVDEDLRERFGNRVTTKGLDGVDVAALDLAEVLREAAQILTKKYKSEE